MKGKRLAVIIGRCLTVCMLALSVNVMTASAETYADIQTDGAEAQITIGVSGYVQLPAAVTPEVPGTQDPEPEAPDEKDDTTVVTPVTDMKTAAPQTGDDTHTGSLLLLLFTAMITIQMSRRIKAGRMNNTELPGNTCSRQM